VVELRMAGGNDLLDSGSLLSFKGKYELRVKILNVVVVIICTMFGTVCDVVMDFSSGVKLFAAI